MKILIVSSWGLPHVGGVNTFVNQLKKGLEQTGHEVDIFCKTPDGQGYYFPNKSLFLRKSKLLPPISEKVTRYFDLHLPGLDPWILMSEIDRYCFEAAASYFGLHKYDLIHTQDIISTHAISRIKPHKTPLVATIHGCLAMEWFVNLKEMGLPEQDQNSLLWHYSANREFIGGTSSDLTMIPSNWLKQTMSQGFTVPTEHLTIAPYGIDVDQFMQSMSLPTEILKPPDKKVIICPARLDIVKGHVHLLHALAKLKAERTDWVCWLVGNGQLEEELKRRTQLLGLDDHVLFLGGRGDVPALINQADLFVLPSVQDNQPYAVMEAQIAGKPVIVSNAGGIPEMVAHMLTGLVTQAGDSEQLYNHLKMALEDERLCQRLGGNAQLWARHYWSLPVMTARIVDVYQRVLEKYKHKESIKRKNRAKKKRKGVGRWRSKLKKGFLQRKAKRLKVRKKSA